MASSNKRLVLIIAALMIGLVAGGAYAVREASDGADHLRFKMGRFDATAQTKNVQEAVKLFNTYYGKFFSLGDYGGLHLFPAENMVKRRIVQEVDIWKRQGKLLIYDKDKAKQLDLQFLSPSHAYLVNQETYFISIQEAETRKLVGGVKALPIKVRYILRILDGQWRVAEYEVFGESEELPPLHAEVFLR